jgi:hypothetical protein
LWAKESPFMQSSMILTYIYLPTIYWIFYVVNGLFVIKLSSDFLQGSNIYKLWENYTEISSHFRCSCLNGDHFSVVKKINGTPVSSTNKTDSHDITEIVMKEALNTMTLYCILQMFSDSVVIFLYLILLYFYFIFTVIFFWIVL